VIVGLSQMAKDLDMEVTESVWVVNAYSLTLASTLLSVRLTFFAFRRVVQLLLSISILNRSLVSHSHLQGGRVADITNPKIVFIVGFLFLGLFSMGVGLSKDKITLLVLRAFSGLGLVQSLSSSKTCFNYKSHTDSLPSLFAQSIAHHPGSHELDHSSLPRTR